MFHIFFHTFSCSYLFRHGPYIFPYIFHTLSYLFRHGPYIFPYLFHTCSYLFKHVPYIFPYMFHTFSYLFRHVPYIFPYIFHTFSYLSRYVPYIFLTGFIHFHSFSDMLHTFFRTWYIFQTFSMTPQVGRATRMIWKRNPWPPPSSSVRRHRWVWVEVSNIWFLTMVFGGLNMSGSTIHWFICYEIWDVRYIEVWYMICEWYTVWFCDMWYMTWYDCDYRWSEVGSWFCNGGIPTG